MSKNSESRFKSYTRPSVMSAGFGVLLVLSAVALGAHSLLAFFSIEGFLIVVGGVMAVAFMSFESADVRKALDAIARLFRDAKPAHENLHRDMMNIIGWARIVKEKGMRDLETSINKHIEDPFVKYGLNMVVSQYRPKEVRDMMETAADACHDRDSIPVEVLQAMTSHAPAFGMVGTLVGMVAMLCNITDNVSHIGSSLAVAFLSTLYGVVSARMVYMPAASKLRQEVANRRFRNQLIVEGMVMLVGNKPPMYVQDRLNSFLRPEMHDYFDIARKAEPQPQLQQIRVQPQFRPQLKPQQLQPKPAVLAKPKPMPAPKALAEPLLPPMPQLKAARG